MAGTVQEEALKLRQNLDKIYKAGLDAGGGSSEEDYERGVADGYENGFADGEASVFVPSKYCHGIQFSDLNLFGKETVTLDLDNATNITNLVIGHTNTTVKHLIVNFKQPVMEFIRVFTNSIPYLERVTLNADLSQAKISGNIFWATPDLKIVDGTPLDMSGLTSGAFFAYSAPNLQEVRFVAGTIKLATSFSSCQSFSAETIQSIVDGLVDLTGQTSQKVQFHSTVLAKLTEEQINTITAKNWTT